MKYLLKDVWFPTKNESDNYLSSLMSNYKQKDSSFLKLDHGDYLSDLLYFCYDNYRSNDEAWLNKKNLHIKPSEWYLVFHSENNKSLGYKSPLNKHKLPVDRRKLFVCFGAGKSQSHKDMVIEAARNEVAYQVRQKVDEYQESNICFYCENEFTDEVLHGDHVYNFKYIWSEFCEDWLINQKEILCEKKRFDTFYGSTFVDENLKNNWIDYHYSRMQIVPACKECNERKK